MYGTQISFHMELIGLCGLDFFIHSRRYKETSCLSFSFFLTLSHIFHLFLRSEAQFMHIYLTISLTLSFLSLSLSYLCMFLCTTAGLVSPWVVILKYDSLSHLISNKLTHYFAHLLSITHSSLCQTHTRILYSIHIKV